MNQYQVTIQFNSGRSTVHTIEARSRKEALFSAFDSLKDADIHVNQLRAERVITTSQGRYVVEQVAGI